MRLVSRQELLLAIAAIVAASTLPVPATRPRAEEPPNERDYDDYDDQEDRTASGGRNDLYFTPPTFAVPFWNVAMCNVKDGYWCGMGVKIAPGKFLMSDQSAAEIHEDLAKYGKDGPPGVFYEHSYSEIDISRENQHGWKWFPSRLEHYAGGISLYEAKKREGLTNSDPDHSDIFVNWDPPKLGKDDEDDEMCRVITYGSDLNANSGIDKPKREWRALYLSKPSCNEENICTFKRSINATHQQNGWTGLLCGKFSSLGAPIICGPDDKLKYVVSEYNEESDDTCTSFLDAVAIWKYDLPIKRGQMYP